MGISIAIARAIALGVLTAILTIAIFIPANILQAQVLQSGTFTASRACAAPRAINGANPGNVRVSKNQKYNAIGFNSTKREYIWLEIPGVTPQRRWVSATCGTFSTVSNSSSSSAASSASSTSSIASSQPNNALLPFFDTSTSEVLVEVNRPQRRVVDITPPPPALNDFDRAVLRTCGPIGTKLKSSDVRRLLSEYPSVVSAIRAAVGGSLVAGRNSPAEFLDDLTSIWTKREGFEHIFCGELEGATKIGGLHFLGRYLQLQQNGQGGRLANNRDREEVIPGVLYTLGVVIKKDGQTWTDELKGYSYVNNAEELMLAATKAYKERGNAQGACILSVRDADSGKNYQAVFVKDRDAIVTFYPDATPQGRSCDR
ncbi:EndoU domain-containing protein [Pseudanabaena sp. PCC 6802]|uniref:EndoU domain-containing protein n=1 Tax=Pseudanabaena sp. PCC 6802 TaxID=118173 RepID=UPI000A013175|nr:EndoU domain-containing protein [Pseudanabaena sp. PCC 6802]